MITEIDGTLEYLQEIEDKYEKVQQKTGELHTACDGLIAEEVSFPLFCCGVNDDVVVVL